MSVAAFAFFFTGMILITSAQPVFNYFKSNIRTNFEGGNFDNYVYIHELCEDYQFQEDLNKCDGPKIVICFSYGNDKNHTYEEESTLPDGSKQITHLGSTRFTHIFYKIQTTDILNLWAEIYGRLTLTKSKQDFFTFASKSYKKLTYDQSLFKQNYWRSQWNQDKFMIADSYDNLTHTYLQYHNNQLPTHLQQQSSQQSPTPSEFAVLFYSIISGGGNGCNSSNLDEELRTLTYSFNAYDMLFCDVFTFYNLTFQVNYEFLYHQHYTSFLLRDDLISAFPPDPNAVFYGSPGITFVLLKEAPILWTNIFLPFDLKVWILVVICSALDFIVSQLRSSKDFKAKVKFQRSSSEIVGGRVSDLFILLGRVVVTAAYGGMILVGILDPLYPWSPKTFKELNETTNYVGATSYHSAVQPENLIDTYVLNGISSWRDRKQETLKKPTPGSYLMEDELDKTNRYALLMYEDRKKHFIYGRRELNKTAAFVHRLEMHKESVLKEIRYISVAPGATKLHFLVEAIRRCFETGSWMKWKGLEDNYVKYVAPILVKKDFGIEDPSRVRVLNMGDFSSAVYVLGVGIALGGVELVMEICKMSLNFSVAGG